MDVGGMFWTKTFGDDDNEDDGDDDDEERADKLCLLHLCLLVHNSWVIPSERNRGWKSPIQFCFFLLMILNLDQKKCHGAKFSPPGAF